MPKDKRESALALTKREAKARLQDLIHEARLLIDLFPHLRDSYDADELPVSFLVEKGGRGGPGKKAPPSRRKK